MWQTLASRRMVHHSEMHMGICSNLLSSVTQLILLSLILSA